MTQEELTTGLQAVKASVDTVTTKVTALETAINAAGDTVPDAVASAFNDLKASVDTLNATAVVPGT